MKAGKVEKYYREILASDGAILWSLIDPDKSSGEKGVRIVKKSEEGGAHAILVGGSIGAQGTRLDETVKAMKEAVSIPIILFPGNISGLTPYADAVYFMYMLNSRDVYWLSTAQIQAAPVVARIGIEIIPTSYVVLEPGRAVGWIGNANLVPRDRPDLAAACALAAKFMGAHMLITDAGSGAPEPAPTALVAAVAKACGGELVYSVAGGVRTPKQAAEIVRAGASGIQIGEAFETEKGIARIREIAQAMRCEGKKRV